MQKLLCVSCSVAYLNDRRGLVVVGVWTLSSCDDVSDLDDAPPPRRSSPLAAAAAAKARGAKTEPKVGRQRQSCSVRRAR